MCNFTTIPVLLQFKSHHNRGKIIFQILHLPNFPKFLRRSKKKSIKTIIYEIKRVHIQGLDI